MIQNSTPQPLQFSPTSPSFSMAPWPPMAALCPRARRCRSRCRGSPNRCQDHGHCPGADLGGSDLRPRDHSEGNTDRFKSKICRKRSEIQQIQQPEMSLYTRRIHSELPMFYFETFMIYHINPYHTYIVISYYSKTSSMIYYPESNYFSILFYIFFTSFFASHIVFVIHDPVVSPKTSLCNASCAPIRMVSLVWLRLDPKLAFETCEFHHTKPGAVISWGC